MITGIRHSGKSTLLKLIVERLKGRGISGDRILFKDVVARNSIRSVTLLERSSKNPIDEQKTGSHFQAEHDNIYAMLQRTGDRFFGIITKGEAEILKKVSQ